MCVVRTLSLFCNQKKEGFQGLCWTWRETGTHGRGENIFITNTVYLVLKNLFYWYCLETSWIFSVRQHDVDEWMSNHRSGCSAVSRVILQVSVLGPLLFIIYLLHHYVHFHCYANLSMPHTFTPPNLIIDCFCVPFSSQVKRLGVTLEPSSLMHLT